MGYPLLSLYPLTIFNILFYLWEDIVEAIIVGSITAPVFVYDY